MFSMQHEAYIRLGFFFGVLLVMALWELAAPRKQLTVSKSVRWLSNLSITFLNTFLVRVVIGLMGIKIAYIAADHNWGILSAFDMPEPLAGVISIIALDFIIYIQHVLFHMLPLLWRLHKMHHADLDIDVTTGARFHPVEILISIGIKMVSIAALGAPPWSVVAFEVLLNATAMFNHANAYLPLGLDRVLRLLVVTPDMHRVHHSPIIKETNSNYGFNLPWWDRLFGTYIAQPARGHTDMKIGLANYRDPEKLTLPWMLIIPFMNKER
jgi:sterol desaturase/sphingolipid hydroxylase (fatty acid hydroxylase superfamily)